MEEDQGEDKIPAGSWGAELWVEKNSAALRVGQS